MSGIINNWVALECENTDLSINDIHDKITKF